MSLPPLGQGLVAVAARLDSRDAREAAATIMQTMTRTKNVGILRPLAQGLPAVTARLDPGDARAIATTLTEAMNSTKDQSLLRQLATGMAAATARLEPREAVTLTLASARMANLPLTQPLAQSLVAGAIRLEPREAATTLILAMSKTTGPSVLTQSLATVLGKEPLNHRPQLLVDLLKQPFCVGPARRLVLDQLGRHYQRPFADQWDFVEYVRQQGLNLDLITPPARATLLAEKG
jgi:hypothetical protein